MCAASQLKVKETHCTVSDLLPNAQYELWVTATNTTGISPASERAVYMTGACRCVCVLPSRCRRRVCNAVCVCAVPSPPVLKPQQCVSSLDAALIRWDSGNTDPVESYTLELHQTHTDESVSCITQNRMSVRASCTRLNRSTFCPTERYGSRCGTQR